MIRSNRKIVVLASSRVWSGALKSSGAVYRHNSTISKLAPGLAVAFATSQVGFAVANELGLSLLRFQGLSVDASTQSPISGIPISILLGLALNNAILEKKPQWSEPLKAGLQAATKPVL